MDVGLRFFELYVTRRPKGYECVVKVLRGGGGDGNATFICSRGGSCCGVRVGKVRFIYSDVRSSCRGRTIRLTRTCRGELPSVISCLVPSVGRVFKVAGPSMVTGLLKGPDVSLSEKALACLRRAVSDLRVVRVRFSNVFATFCGSYVSK